MRLFLTIAIFCYFYSEAYGKVSLDIDMKLKTLNKPALKTIKSQDGDIIDCIDIHKQHAFDHPALRNHKIQMKPSVAFGTTKTTAPKNGTLKPITSQIWSKSGNCPIGTIPVRRVSREDIRRASSPSRFGMKTTRRYNALSTALQRKAKAKANFNLTAEMLRQPRPKDRSDAMLIALGYSYIGAKSDINLWNPPRVEPQESSSSQIWLLSGLSDDFETVEAGWVVNPSVFGDSRTRLYTYWTSDSYATTGCMNLLCSGFVQTSTRYVLGAAIEPISTTSSEQYIISVSIFLDPNSAKWWLTFGDTVMGYWPPELFDTLKHSATAVQWGGEVYSPNVMKKPHTKTAMGSGQWASYLYGEASFHTNVRIQDYSLQIKYPERTTEYGDEYDCYSTKLHRDNYKAEPFFYFGGPGQNRRCP
ncbi:unnamed protein product [Thlaspi arvense]|uniref:Neprosin PEP catalytic domain-containing protein n=1 Tax=Thlaspi arvense TaxID=13288 RepID=A0AAU9RJV3_THLAR|nr:unnamed protein product [Thlaspi arvense]